MEADKEKLQVQVVCTPECKWEKKYLLKLFLDWWGGIKENGGGGEFKYDVFDIL
jgi:hypothetical protein